jgi:hypothetical protein
VAYFWLFDANQYQSGFSQLEGHQTLERLMAHHSSLHFYLARAKERIDEMDATLADLQRHVEKLQSDGGAEARHLIAQLRSERDDFQSAVRHRLETGEETVFAAAHMLETKWNRFEAKVDELIHYFGKQVEDGSTVFRARAEAQSKAWKTSIAKLQAAAKSCTGERRSRVDSALIQLKDDARLANERLRKLGKAGSESWAALKKALAETRSAFEHADEVAREAFKHVGSSAK